MVFMFILKHSKSSDTDPDKTKMLVISNLFKKPGFRKEDGWDKFEWTRNLTVVDKKTKKDKPNTHKVIYLKHRGNNFFIHSVVLYV